MLNKNEIKFYEFDGDYPYWAVVMANSKEEATQEYEKVVCSIDAEDKDNLSPSEISKEETLNFCADNDKSSDEYYTKNEFEKDCLGNKAVVIAIDPSLF